MVLLPRGPNKIRGVGGRLMKPPIAAGSVAMELLLKKSFAKFLSHPLPPSCVHRERWFSGKGNFEEINAPSSSGSLFADLTRPVLLTFNTARLVLK